MLCSNYNVLLGCEHVLFVNSIKDIKQYGNITMYGTHAQYGWSNGPRSSEVVELPLAPVRRRSDNIWCGGGINWLSFGIILSLLAAASLALGVADVVLTHQTYMVDRKCADNQNQPECDKNNLVWTWVAVGIWASLPIFIFVILAIRLGKSHNPVRSSWFEMFAFISAFIFAPAMIVLSAIQVYKGHDIYYWNAVDGDDDLAKAIIPIVIAGLGLVEFLMCFIAIIYVCCCRNNYSSTEVVTYRQPAIDVGQRTFVETRPAMPAITYGGGCQTGCNTGFSNPAPRVTACSGPGRSCGGGGGVYYRSPATTGFSPRPTTYNYFANARPVAQSPYNWRS